MNLKPVGTVHSPYKVRADSPHQGRFSEKLSKHFIILYWQDKAERDKLQVVPHGKTEKRGVFTTRAPARPNPIALCLVELVKLEGRTLTVKWLDALDGSPVLDIKPYSVEIDCL